MPLTLDQDRFSADHAALRVGAHAVEADCEPVLQQFHEHSLEQQATLDLADRTDSKYLLPIQLLPRFLQAVAGDHSILDCAGHRVFTYQNTYFDTPAWDLYLQHHNGKRNRHKCRFRRYHETDTSYLEIKFKSNKRRTVKERMLWVAQGPAEVPREAMPRDVTLAPSLYINYRRISLWNRASDERLTLDYDLYFRRPQQSGGVRLADFFIVELKREGKVYGSPFVRRAKDFGYIPLALSKYCVGVCLTDHGQLKHNRFKPLLRKLGRIHTTGGLSQ